MSWVRIDNRLVHGQIIEAWLPYLGASIILVVNDELADDVMRQEIMRLAVPSGVELFFSRVEGVQTAMRDNPMRNAPDDVLLLFATCVDANRAHQAGLSFSALNIGNLHYGPGKQQVCAHVALSSEDIGCLRYFRKSGVRLDFRCVPNDTTQVRGTW